MNVEIITIGDEILIGQIVDTNSAWMAQELNKAGFEICKITSIGDDEKDILETLKEATERSPIVLITGGLGPTRDDITKKTLCKFFDTQLIFNENVYKDIVEMLSYRNVDVNQLNKEQAFVPENCEIIRNPAGTAPVMWFNLQNGVLVSMPGVPVEMQFAMSNSIIPKLSEKFQTDIIVHKTINVFNIPESVLAERLTEWENNLPALIKLAYLPSFGKIRLRLTGKGSDIKTVEAAIEKNVETLYPIIGDYIYGFDEISPQESILQLLKNKKSTLVTAESCTGGNIAHLITSVAGASECFKGGIVAYSNQIKTDFLGVNKEDLNKFGAVSRQVVEQMALGVCKTFNADYAIATSGIAGPSGGTPQKPVGTVWIAWALNGKVISKLYKFGNDRERTKIRASDTALIKFKQMISI